MILCCLEGLRNVFDLLVGNEENRDTMRRLREGVRHVSFCPLCASVLHEYEVFCPSCDTNFNIVNENYSQLFCGRCGEFPCFCGLEWCEVGEHYVEPEQMWDDFNDCKECVSEKEYEEYDEYHGYSRAD